MSTWLPWAVFALVLAISATCEVHPLVTAAARGLREFLHISWAGPLIVFAVSFALNAAPPIAGLRLPPSIHDSYSYLLAADTFLHGRLSNPTPPGADSLEALHEIVRPTYASKYPPGQGLFIAAGKFLHLPYAGLSFVMALACAATCWMCRAWLPAGWALLAGLLAAAAPISVYWGGMYWGGGPAMLAGALFGGAILRLMRRPAAHHSPWTGAIAAIGLALMANTRPLEGCILAIILGIALLIALRGGTRINRSHLRAFGVAISILLAAGAWMLYYNWRVTGNPLLLPYIVSARQYQTVPLFRFQEAHLEPHYTDERLREYYAVHEREEFDAEQSIKGAFAATGRKLAEMADIWLHAQPLFLAMVAAAVGAAGMLTRKPRLYRAAKTVILPVAVVVLLPAIQMAVTPWMRLQYLAPGAAFLYLAIAGGARYLARLLRLLGPAIGRAAVAVGPAMFAAQLLLGFYYLDRVVLPELPKPADKRAAIVDSLVARGGKHLILVEYQPGSSILREFIWNDADPPSSPVVFARDLGPQQNARLWTAYPNRQPWILAVSPEGADDVEMQLMPLDKDFFRVAPTTRR